MRTVLVTGGIGSGKSTVCRFFAEAGVPVYDSDTRTKSLYDSDLSLVKDLESQFGISLRNPEGKLDRKALASLIFGDADALARAEAVIHPYVRKDFEKWASQYQDEPFVVMESAIAASKPVFEGMFDAVVLVDAPVDLRVERACGRDGAAEDEVRRRVASQDFSFLQADLTIWNDSDMAVLRKRADDTLNLILTPSGTN